jgi:acyl dehydratase
MTIEHFPVEAGHVMMFARAIADTNPVYHDADVANASETGAIPAPPTFVTAGMQFDDENALRPRPGQPWFGSGREATGVKREPSSEQSGGGGGSSLHAEEHYEFHRPLVVGDVLHTHVVPGTTWDKEGRSGTLQFTETITEFLDEHDELVVTARRVVVRTERPK